MGRTYDQVSNVLDQPSRERVEQIVDAQLPYLGKVDQVIACREEPCRNDAHDSAQQENSTEFPLALGVHDLDLVPGRNGAVIDGLDGHGVFVVLFLFPFSFGGSAAQLCGHDHCGLRACSATPSGSRASVRRFEVFEAWGFVLRRTVRAFEAESSR